MSRLGRLVLCTLGALLAIPLLAGPAAAHPLGNFTVNRYAGLVVRPEAVTVELVVDLAEVPAYQRRFEIDVDRSGSASAAERSAFAASECAAQTRALSLTVSGVATPLRPAASAVELPPGQAELPTVRLTCTADAAVALAAGGSAFDFRDAAGGGAGWREVTAVGDGTTLVTSDVPATSVSARLTAYPDDLLQSPLDVRGASFIARTGGPRLAVAATADDDSNDDGAVSRGLDRATAAFTRLVGERRLTVGVGLVAFALAVGLGALHALAPGHGKTVMAAFLVGERGSLRQAWLIGLTVTVTHTAGVLLLGLTLTATDVAAPERVYPLLGAASGLLLGGVGVMLLVRALRAARATQQHQGHEHPHPHDHDHGEDHDDDRDPDHGHHGHDHPHANGHDDGDTHRHGVFSHRHVVPDVGRPLGWRSVVAMGFAGSLVPSPSALVVLLGAVALGRAWFGVVLVLAYGIGMAATLTGAGLLLARARDRLDRRTAASARLARAFRLVRLLPGRERGCHPDRRCRCRDPGPARGLIATITGVSLYGGHAGILRRVRRAMRHQCALTKGRSAVERSSAWTLPGAAESPPMVIQLVEAHLRAALGPDTGRASVTFVGTEPVEVLRFGPDADGIVRYATLGMSRAPMSEPTTYVAEPVTGPRAELLLSVRGVHDSVLRRLATLAAAPVVEGLVVVAGASLDLGEPLWDGAAFSAVLVGEPGGLVPDQLLPPADDGTERGPVEFFPLLPMTAGEAAWKRVHGAAALEQRWLDHAVDLRDPQRVAVPLG